MPEVAQQMLSAKAEEDRFKGMAAGAKHTNWSAYGRFRKRAATNHVKEEFSISNCQNV
jgi:hypothetical protein